MKKIENSSSPIIHPLNSERDSQLYSSELHDYKNENVNFSHVYETVGLFLILKKRFLLKNILKMLLLI